MIEKPSSSHVQSVERAIQLVDLLASEGQELSLTEISKAMGWPKSTVHGLLSTLRENNYVEQSAVSSRYRLGIRLFELGNTVARSWDIRAVALPVMQGLNRKLGEMVHLATEDKGEVLYIEKLDSRQMFRIVSETGVRLPMHCSGLGKVLLAFKTRTEVKWILTKRGMTRMTQHTITDPQILEKELARIRSQGYGVDDREIMDSLRCVAAPIFTKEGKAAYAVSVSGLADNMTGERLESIIHLVKEAAATISHQMGHRAEDTGS